MFGIIILSVFTLLFPVTFAVWSLFLFFDYFKLLKQHKNSVEQLEQMKLEATVGSSSIEEPEKKVELDADNSDDKLFGAIFSGIVALIMFAICITCILLADPIFLVLWATLLFLVPVFCCESSRLVDSTKTIHEKDLVPALSPPVPTPVSGEQTIEIRKKEEKKLGDKEKAPDRNNGEFICRDSKISEFDYVEAKARKQKKTPELV